jgi:hypothetical protein
MGLQRFEQRLERLVEGVFAKAFRTGLQPVELGRRLVREMDLNRTLGVRGTIVPNRFSISLSPADRERFAELEHTLIAELVDTARQHAREEGYRFLGMVTVDLATDSSVSTGTFLLTAAVREGGHVAGVVLPDGTRIEIGDDPVVIGRAPECDVVLADPTVSKRHISLGRRGVEVVLSDLGSTNGTRVNGVAARERVLVDGDMIQVGATVLRFEAI